MRSGSIWAGKSAFLAIALVISHASAATLTPASSFVDPSIATFTTSLTTFVSPDAYTEAGATFRAGVPGGILFTYFGTLQLAYSSLAYPAGLFEVSFAGTERRFGFEANPLNAQIANPSAWTVTQVDFFLNSDFTSLIDSYTAGFNVGASPAFFGLTSTGEFRSVRIALLSAGGGFSPYLDDFRFDDVPEASAVTMVGVGLLTMFTFVARRLTNRS